MSEFNVAPGTLFVCRDLLHDDISLLFICYKDMFGTTSYMSFLRTYKIAGKTICDISLHGHPTTWKGTWYALEPNSDDFISVRSAFKV